MSFRNKSPRNDDICEILKSLDELVHDVLTYPILSHSDPQIRNVMVIEVDVVMYVVPRIVDHL